MFPSNLFDHGVGLKFAESERVPVVELEEYTQLECGTVEPMGSLGLTSRPFHFTWSGTLYEQTKWY